MKTRILMLGSILAGILLFSSCRTTDAYDRYPYPQRDAAYREAPPAFPERAYTRPAVPAAPSAYPSPGYQGQAPAPATYEQPYDQQGPEPPPLEQPGEQSVMAEVPGAEQATSADPHANHYPAEQPAAQPYPPQQNYPDSGTVQSPSPYPYQGSTQENYSAGRDAIPPDNGYAAGPQAFDSNRDPYTDDRYRRYDDYRYDNERRPSINYDYFYQRLSPYGDWVRHSRYGWVWCPAGVSVGWRPYAVGNWAWTDDYGWMWNSDERWGWATYHYGRWAFDNDYGWCWAPGYTWAPAWVVWRHSPRYVGWAPIPPEVSIGFHLGFHLDVGYSERHIRPYHWNFIGQHDFGERDYSRHLISPYGNTMIINNTTNITNYTIVNNHIVNRSVQVNEIERATNKRVSKYRVNRTDSLLAHGAVRGDNTLEVFAPTVKADSRTKEPPRDIASRSDADGVKRRHSRNEQTFQSAMTKESQEVRQGKRLVDAPAPELVSVPNTARRSQREAVVIPPGGASRRTLPSGGLTPSTKSTPSMTSTPSTPQSKPPEPTRRMSDSPRITVRPSQTSTPGVKPPASSTPEIRRTTPQPTPPPSSATDRRPTPAFPSTRRDTRSNEAGPKVVTPTPKATVRPDVRSQPPSDNGSARIRQSTPPPVVRTMPSPTVRPSTAPTPRIQVRPVDPPATTSRPSFAPDASSRSRVPVRPDTSRSDNAPDFRSYRTDSNRSVTPAPTSRPDVSRSETRRPEPRAEIRIPESRRSSSPPPTVSRSSSPPPSVSRSSSPPPSVSRSSSPPPAVSRSSSPPPSVSRSSSPPPAASRPSAPERSSRSESARSDSGNSSSSRGESDKGSRGRGK